MLNALFCPCLEKYVRLCFTQHEHTHAVPSVYIPQILFSISVLLMKKTMFALLVYLQSAQRVHTGKEKFQKNWQVVFFYLKLSVETHRRCMTLNVLTNLYAPF